MPPSKFCKEVCEKLLWALEQGYPIKSACGYAGIGERTYYDWQTEANNAKRATDLTRFFDKVDAAQSKGEYKLDHPYIKAITEDEDVKVALKYKELRVKAEIARAAKDAHRLNDDSEIEITEDDVEWINHVSSYN